MDTDRPPGLGEPKKGIPPNTKVSIPPDLNLEKIHPKREVLTYDACWQIADPAFTLVETKRLADIGVPLDAAMSNDPRNPVYLSRLMATLEKNLGLVRAKGQIIYEDPYPGSSSVEIPPETFVSGRDYWEKYCAGIALEMTNRLSEVFYRIGILNQDNDPAVVWARNIFLQLPQRWQKIITKYTNGEDFLLPHEVKGFMDRNLVHMEELENITSIRLKIFAERLGLNKDEGGFFTLIDNIFSSLRDRYSQDSLPKEADKRSTIESLLYSRKISVGEDIIPWGVVATDEWNWNGFEEGRIKPMFHTSTNSPDYQGEGDSHVGAQTAMWRTIRGSMKQKYQREDIDVPYPPNLETGYRMVIPYVGDGKARRLTLVYFNDISRVNPEVLEQARWFYTKSPFTLHSSDVFFIAPDGHGENKVWRPIFSDTKSADFIMAVQPKTESLVTLKFKNLPTGISL